MENLKENSDSLIASRALKASTREPNFIVLASLSSSSLLACWPLTYRCLLASRSFPSAVLRMQIQIDRLKFFSSSRSDASRLEPQLGKFLSLSILIDYKTLVAEKEKKTLSFNTTSMFAFFCFFFFDKKQQRALLNTKKSLR